MDKYSVVLQDGESKEITPENVRDDDNSQVIRTIFVDVKDDGVLVESK